MSAEIGTSSVGILCFIQLQVVYFAQPVADGDVAARLLPCAISPPGVAKASAVEQGGRAKALQARTHRSLRQASRPPLGDSTCLVGASFLWLLAARHCGLRKDSAYFINAVVSAAANC